MILYSLGHFTLTTHYLYLLSTIYILLVIGTIIILLLLLFSYLTILLTILSVTSGER